MHGSRNAALYPPLQEEFHKGLEMGTDHWVNKNRLVKPLFIPQMLFDSLSSAVE